MALTVTGFSSTSLTYKIASETNASDTVQQDIFGGSGVLYAIEFDNQDTSNDAYLKLKLTSGAVTVGTTEPDLMFHLDDAAGGNANQRSATTIQLPNGLPFDQLSFWVTDAAATSDQGDPGTVVLTFLAS
tara:strand:+ start:525 stop:914 length:390 start_codon:yes stop_codon:yes gene_type:complete